MGRREKIFISYRRDRSGEDAQRVFKALEQRFGAGRLIMDDAVSPAGKAPAAPVEKRLADTAVMLVLIGEKWLDRAGPDGGRGGAGTARLQWMEIAKALKERIEVIPVLVDQATRPGAAALPVEIAGLARLQPFRLRRSRLQGDVEDLQQAVGDALGGDAGWSGPRRVVAARGRPSFFRVLLALLFAAGIGAAVYYLGKQ